MEKDNGTIQFKTADIMGIVNYDTDACNDVKRFLLMIAEKVGVRVEFKEEGVKNG